MGRRVKLYYYHVSLNDANISIHENESLDFKNGTDSSSAHKNSRSSPRSADDL